MMSHEMVQEEKLKKICDDFTRLNEEQQAYMLGILQALVFANNNSANNNPGNNEG